MALSGVVIQDKAGGYENIDFLLNYAYHLKISKKWKLGMGIRAGVLNARFGGDNIARYWDLDDNVVLASNYNSMLPRFGLGFHLYNSLTYVSLTSPDMVVVDPTNVLLNKK